MGAKWKYEVENPEMWGMQVARLVNLGQHKILHQTGDTYYWHIAVKSGLNGALGNDDLLKLYEACSKKSSKGKKRLGSFNTIFASKPMRKQWTLQSPTAIAFLSALILPHLDYDNKKTFQFVLNVANVEKEIKPTVISLHKFDGIPSPAAKWRIKNKYTIKELGSILGMAANAWGYLESGQVQVSKSWRAKLHWLTKSDKLADAQQAWFEGHRPEPTDTLVHQLENAFEGSIEQIHENFNGTYPIDAARLYTIKRGGIPTGKEAITLMRDLGCPENEISQKAKEAIDKSLEW